VDCGEGEDFGMTICTARGVSYYGDGDRKHGAHPMLSDAHLTLRRDEVTMLIGPNGAGKTTLIRLLLGLLTPDNGTVAWHSEAPLAQTAAYLPQSRPLIWPQPVRDVVALGRFAFGAVPSRLSALDVAAVERAMDQADVAHLSERAADTLSGGEAARVHLARALAAQTPYLIADEPAAALDLKHQHGVMALFRDLAAQGRGVLAVVHDLTLAAAYADRLIWMDKGRIIADGPPAHTLTAQRLAAVFGVTARVEAHDGRVQLSEVKPV
jgi:iron complex transport system ATP-binding protein